MDAIFYSLVEKLAKLCGRDKAFHFHRYAMCVALEDAGLLDIPVVSRSADLIVLLTAELGSESDLALLRDEVGSHLRDGALVESNPRLFFALHALLFVLQGKLDPTDDIEHYNHTFRETVDLACGRREP